MEFRRHTGPHIHIIPNTLDFGGIDEVTWTHCLSYHVVIVLAWSYFKAQLFGNVQKLLSDFSHFPQRLVLKKVMYAPFLRKTVFFPLLKYIQESQVITFRDQQLLTGRLSLSHLVFWFVEYAWNWQHWNDGYYFLQTSQLIGGNYHFGQRRIDRELSHSSPQRCQTSQVV